MKTLEDHNNERSKHYKMLGEGLPKYNNIACPKCGDELVDTNPNMVLTSYPPKKHVKCLSCGHVDYRIL